jgi:hypothetical protein
MHYQPTGIIQSDEGFYEILERYISMNYTKFYPSKLKIGNRFAIMQCVIAVYISGSLILASERRI